MFANAINELTGRARTVHDYAAASHRRAVTLLVFFALACFLPGFFSLQPMDRDEPRFAQASKQMLETRDFVRIRFQDTARNNKPAGIYWLQSASVATASALGASDARRTIWLYRLPSLAGAIAAVLLTYWTALAFVARGPAMLAAILAGSTILLGVEAHLAKTDAVLLATILAAMGTFARIYQGASADQSTSHEPGWRLPLIFWAAIGVGLLIKGPITPMVPFFTAIALVLVDRRAPWFRRLRLWPGLLIALLIAAPWFVMIIIETKGAFLADSVGKDMLAKVGAGKESHGAPPLTYAVAFLGTAWPMAPLAILAAPSIWKNRREPAFRFLLSWIVPVWLLFELVPTKLPHYVLPAYPAIAILVAISLQYMQNWHGSRWRQWVSWLMVLVPVLLFVAGAVLAFKTGIWPGWTWFVFGPLAVFLAWGAIRPALIPSQRVVLAGLSAITLYVATYSGILVAGPGSMAAISPQLAGYWHSLPGRSCKEPKLASAGYYEPSLVFLTRTDIIMTNAPGAAKHIAGGACRMAFVEARNEPEFKNALAGQTGLKLVGRVKGINLNGGKNLDIGVWLRQ